ncbi:lipoprotein-releasing ABC transporter permease subunit LolE [Halomonas denitrificans]|uniref:lipoprotein-releasing ABC transporter permease subunit LolE n=1 Tax=Ferrimonas balearica TaxID=44012 RepID=UPI001C59F559|nr:lipoprotein-releasing ABC transporter permease subunit LolE [Ferrimonas balearica]MBW3140303.1 lipoprotein-releasing ABC transporter permease subunit LolE [Ferrimonas balearica]MBY6018474.1 lipoprotein-releasing ABC transporter permease subunit LolE [Halomonas denitrificans]MBY6106588.1 lipoprotein-releasing ABC transporter permease subunit LolE [Ferrimonas balearica]
MLNSKGPLALQIGWRFLRARNNNRFVSFISLSSVVGVALGVTVLILVLSAMNGFERELKDRLLAVVPHAEMTAIDTPIVDWPAMVQSAEAEPGVAAAAPFVLIEGMLQKGDTMKPVALRGVLPKWEKDVSDAHRFMSDSAWNSLSDNQPNLVLGKALATQLGVEVGDRISLLLPRAGAGPLAGYRTRHLTITGLFDLGGEIDRTVAFTNLAAAAELAGMGDGVSGVRIRADNLFEAPQLIRNIGFAQHHPLYLTDWTRTQGHLYSDIQLIRTLTYLVLVLVVAVASFNIICSLVMSVRDKQAEIAILRTMGMGRRGILQSFMVQGALTGLLGCLIGAALGSILAWKLSDLMAALERLFGIRFLSGDIYFIDFLPSELHWQDVASVSLLAFAVTLVATWYPAWQASRLQPAQVL